jgi:multidrug resistance efflux pump
MATPLQPSSPQIRVSTDAMDLAGKTQPAPGKSATIAPAVLHPVTDVLVKLGDRVKKEQPLVKIDDDEPQADLRAKKAGLVELQASLARLKAQPREEERNEMRAALQSTRVSLKDARQTLDRLTQAFDKGTIPAQKYYDALASHGRFEAEEKAAIARLERLLKLPIELEIAEMEAKVANAKANVDASAAELEHYTVVAGVDGVVSRLDVNPGTVSRPGTSVWGEILDLREMDVRCEVTPAQALHIAVGQPAEVYQQGNSGSPWKGQVVFVSPAADQRTGQIPVLVRLNTPQEDLRCYIDVRVHLSGNRTK